ncbi:Golgi membrane protein 1 isoform X1 [Alosa sapidissima]|uniref:Golgi membrane protein 1 isoform X1 n=1 Tax=Alosa sapidissima TaxID=34773 RepID=UPI001C0859CA|nr:Golgi membrane protein 1 isoform X1 [Alosa sapidissima]
MGALGNGRRVGRSPPLLIAALTTCILVLGFNYWVANSRNTELQAQVYELETRVRRGEADREEVSQRWEEAEETMRRQSQQIRELEEQHQRQEATLHINVSSCSKTVQDVKNQLKSSLDNLEKLRKELQTCQSSVNTLNNKLTYDTAQCNTQILALKEDCEERMAAAAKDAQKKQEKNLQTNPAVSPQKDAPLSVGNLKANNEDSANRTAQAEQPTPSVAETQADQAPNLAELKSNDIVVNDGATPTQRTPAADVKDNAIAQELGGDMSVIGQKDEQPPKATANPDAAKAAKLSLTGEDALMPGEGPVEYTDQTEADNTEKEGGLDNLDDYEENEPESEDDKQAALALD